MSKIYKNQSRLTLKLSTGVNIATATALKINYRKPSGTTGELVGILDGTETIKYDAADPSFLNESGEWTFWSFVTFADGRSAPGTPVRVLVYDPGN